MQNTKKNNDVNDEIRGVNNSTHQSVQIIINPKTIHLDKAVQDIMQINELITAQIPSVRIKSITVDDYFAVVKAYIPNSTGTNLAILRLHEINNAWRIREYASSKSLKS